MYLRPSKRRWSLVWIGAAAGLGLAGMLFAQGRGGGQPPPPPPNPSSDPLLRGFEFRSIGPATMMGRLDDIVGSEKDPMIMYLGFATGGVWKSIDGGNHWKSQFDNMPNESVGVLALVAPASPSFMNHFAATGRTRALQIKPATRKPARIYIVRS